MKNHFGVLLLSAQLVAGCGGTDIETVALLEEPGAISSDWIVLTSQSNLPVHSARTGVCAVLSPNDALIHGLGAEDLLDRNPLKAVATAPDGKELALTNSAGGESVVLPDGNGRGAVICRNLHEGGHPGRVLSVRVSSLRRIEVRAIYWVSFPHIDAQQVGQGGLPGSSSR